MSIEKTILDNGLTVSTDSIPNFETISVGVFVNVGSVNESENLCGVSHFVEHMAFKGTTSRTAIQIAESIEAVGGHMNAYTSKEITAYHAKVLKEDLELAVDVITDIIQNSIFDDSEFEKERGVIIQEIRQTNDTPDDVVFDIFQSKCFENEPLGWPILGRIENVQSFAPQHLLNYMQTNYSTSKMILAAAGNVEHTHLVDLAQKYTTKLHCFDTEIPEQQRYTGGFINIDKNLEQKHIIVGFEGASHEAFDKLDLLVLSTALGGGMSSRLFQEIREKRGLAYSIFSYASSYRDSGVFGVYTGCDVDKSTEVVELIRDELKKASKNINEEEIKRAKTQIKTSLLMGLESSSNRMERIAKQHLLHGRFFTSEEMAKLIDETSIESIGVVLERILLTPPTMAVVGPGNEIEKLYGEFAQLGSGRTRLP
jgi:predicted Zn-dependent peptidase